jgi:hypothetical protein
MVEWLTLESANVHQCLAGRRWRNGFLDLMGRKLELATEFDPARHGSPAPLVRPSLGERSASIARKSGYIGLPLSAEALLDTFGRSFAQALIALGGLVLSRAALALAHAHAWYPENQLTDLAMRLNARVRKSIWCRWSNIKDRRTSGTLQV